MTRPLFPLFQTHLDLAHAYWNRLVQHGDIVVDATCGNGHDTLLLAELALAKDKGMVYGLDIQHAAITKTSQLIENHLPSQYLSRVKLLGQCHSTFPSEIEKESVKLIVYNLGYLPGSDKSITTMLTTTLQSLSSALDLLCSGGCISLTAYPGHTEGAHEEQALLRLLEGLDKQLWSCCHHRWVNRKATSPSLFLIQKLC